jgi:hypothetical protein
MTDQTNDQHQEQQQPDWVTNPDLFDPERAKRLILNLRADVDKMRAERDAAEAHYEQLTTLDEQRAEDQRRLDEQRAEILRLKIRNDAISRGVPDPDLIPTFIDSDLWAVDSNAAFQQLRESKPSLFNAKPFRGLAFG